jgi:hypothetical protein
MSKARQQKSLAIVQKRKVGKGSMPAGTLEAAKPFKVTSAHETEVREFHDREKARPKPAKIKLEKRTGNIQSLTLAPATGEYAKDVGAGTVAVARLTKTLGGVDYDAANRLLRDLMYATNTKDGTNDQFVNESLALVAAIAPRDGIEAMLAVQMVNTHGLINEFHRRIRNSVETIPQQDSNGGLLVRLERTFLGQVEALKRYRTGGEQRVNVTHQHVTVNADKAAVAVNPPSANGPGVGGTEKTEEQPHEPKPAQLAYTPGDPLPGTFETDRQAVRERPG